MNGSTSQQPVAPADALPADTKLPEVLKLEAQRASGANWLVTIAGFSVLNLAILLFNGGISFVVGLGITQLLGGFAYGFSQNADANGAFLAWTICGTITLLIAGLFVWLASRAKRGHAWAFVVGMVLYAIDGLIFLVFQDWLPVAFHVYALVMVYTGLKAHLGIAKVVATAVPQHGAGDTQPVMSNDHVLPANHVLPAEQGHPVLFRSPLLPGIASVVLLLAAGIFATAAMSGGKETLGLLIFFPFFAFTGIWLGRAAWLARNRPTSPDAS